VDERAKYFRRLRRLRRSARRWSVFAGTFAGASVVLVPYGGLGWPDAILTALTGGTAALTFWRWSDLRQLAAQPAPEPLPGPLGGPLVRTRFEALVARLPAGRTALTELRRMEARSRIRGSSVLPAWTRLDRAAQTLAGLTGRLPTLPMSYADLERRAAQALPPSVVSYVAGGAGDEATQRANVGAFGRWGLAPRMFVGARERDLSVELFGMRWPAPLFMAPVGVIGICAQDGHGDLATARQAFCPASLLYCVSAAACALRSHRLPPLTSSGPKCRRGARVHSAAHLLARASGLATGGRTGDQHQSRPSLRPRLPFARGTSGSDGVAVPASRRLTGRHDHSHDGQPDERDKDQEHVANLCAVL